MGAFLVNVQVRVASNENVPAVVKAVCRGTSRVAPTGDGWAGVYNERLDAQDEKELLRVGRALSKRLAASAVAFLVHDSDVLACWTFAGGRVVDAFNSMPDYFGNDSAPPPDHDASAAALASVAGVALESLREVLAGDWVFAEQQLEALAGLLGIDADAACGFADAASLAGVVEVGGRRKRRPRPAEFAMLVQWWAMVRLPCEALKGQPPLEQPAEVERRIRHFAEMEAWENHAPPDVDALIAATEHGPEALARLILAQGQAVVFETAAALASVGCTDVLRAMHAQGHDLAARSRDTWPPLCLAAVGGNIATLSMMLDFGLDPNARFGEWTPLALVVVHGGGDAAARLLLDRGADATTVPQGMTLREWAESRASLAKPLPDDVLARLP